MNKLVTWFKVALTVGVVVAVVLAFRGDRSPKVVYLALTILVASSAAAFVRSVRARRRSAAYDRDESAALRAPLAAGDCVLHGKVAYARGKNEAMRMEFVQEGSESESSGSWSHQWKEIARKLTVQPFYVVRPDGSRVRVEPPPDQSRLFDDLESKILVRSELDTNLKVSGPVRGRFATLVPDETIWVTGRLVRGVDPEAGASDGVSAYRTSGRGDSWVLTGAPTLLVSSVSLAKHFAERARRHFRDGIIYAVVLVAPLVMLHRYVDRAGGETVTATVQKVREVQNDDGQTTGYVAVVRHADRILETESLDAAPEVGSAIAMRIGQHSYNTGPVARYSVGEQVTAFVILMVCIILRWILFHYSAVALPWYRSEKITVDEGGNGRLPQT